MFNIHWRNMLYSGLHSCGLVGGYVKSITVVTIEVFIGKPVGRVGIFIFYMYENGVEKKSKG